MAEGSASKVGGYRRHVGVQELVHHMQRGVCWPPSIGGMLGFSKLLMSMSTEGAAMVGGEQNNQKLKTIKYRDVVDYFMGVHVTKYGFKWLYVIKYAHKRPTEGH